MASIKRANDFVLALQTKYCQTVLKVLLGVLIVALQVFLGFAIAYNFQSSIALLCFVSVGWLATCYYFLLYPALNHFSPQIETFAANIKTLWKRVVVKVIVYIALAAAFIVFLIIITDGSWTRKVSIGGLFVYIALSVLLSNNASRVS
jgi:hypothetical protein